MPIQQTDEVKAQKVQLVVPRSKVTKAGETIDRSIFVIDMYIPIY